MSSWDDDYGRQIMNEVSALLQSEIQKQFAIKSWTCDDKTPVYTLKNKSSKVT